MNKRSAVSIGALRTLGFVLIALPLLSITSTAQDRRGRITGVVTDQSGAVIPGVLVTAQSSARRQPQTTTTAADGTYGLPDLPSGAYALTFDLRGFSRVSREGIRVEVGQSVSVDVQLAPATLSETVAIVASDDGYAPRMAAVAGKLAAPLIEIPHSVTVVTQEQIRDRNLFNVGEAVKTVAGVTVMPFDGTNPDYRARGFVLDYAYDGVPSTFSSGVPEFDLVIYDRLEVQRGPTGVFRGAGSPGGTINLIRKRGQDRFTLSGTQSAGSWSNYRTEFDLGGPLIKGGRLRGRLVGAFFDRDFFQDTSHTRKGTAMGAVDVDVTRNTALGASVSYQDTVADTPMSGQPAFTDQRYLGFARNFQHLPNWNVFTESMVEYAGEISHRIGRWAFVARPLHRTIPRAWEDAFIQPGTGVDPATLTAVYVNRRSSGENGKTAVDAYAAGTFALFGRTHELTAGYSYDKRTTSFLNRGQVPVGRFSILDVESIPRTPAQFTGGSETDLRQSGFHGQLRLRPVERLTVVLGGRISDYTNSSRNIAPSPPTDFRVTARERDRLTPSAGAVFHLTDTFTVYGSYSDIFNPQTAQRSDGTVLDPRVGAQNEVGVKSRLLGGMLTATAAVFRSKDTNRALADAAAPGFFVPAGVVRIDGVEFEVAGTVRPGLNVTASYTNTRTEYEVGTAAQTGTTFDVFTPHHQGKFYARYEPAAWGGAFVAANVDAQSGVVGGGVPGIREQSAFAVAGVQAGWRLTPQFLAFVSVNNIFDTRYYQRVGSINTYNFYGEPRNVLLTLRVTY